MNIDINPKFHRNGSSQEPRQACGASDKSEDAALRSQESSGRLWAYPRFDQTRHCYLFIHSLSTSRRCCCNSSKERNCDAIISIDISEAAQALAASKAKRSKKFRLTRVITDRLHK